MNATYSKERAAKGQEALNEGDYSKAINYFKVAIDQSGGSNSVYYSLRAKSYYLHLSSSKNPANTWTKIEHDCRAALELDKFNYDASYYLALHMVEFLENIEEGMNLLQDVYEKSMIQSKNTKKYTLPQQIYHKILILKKSNNEKAIDSNMLESQPLFKKIVKLLEAEYQQNLASLKASGRYKEDGAGETSKATKLSMIYNKELQNLRKIFTNSFNHANSRRRLDPPDYLCDPISLNIFHDPVITPSGHSYEKSWLFQYLDIQEVDPLTRQKLTKSQCYPNNFLKKCVEEYLTSVGKNLDV